jgi:hypothetical protein
MTQQLWVGLGTVDPSGSIAQVGCDVSPNAGSATAALMLTVLRLVALVFAALAFILAFTSGVRRT